MVLIMEYTKLLILMKRKTLIGAVVLVGTFFAFAATAAPAGKTVFVSSSLHTGDLNGIAGADKICQGLANNAGLAGLYKAWISIPTSSPAQTRFVKSTVPYFRVDGIKVAENWEDLIDGELDAPINLTENNVVLSGTDKVMTSTFANGYSSAGKNCNNWTSSSIHSNTLMGEYLDDYRWTGSCFSLCSIPSRLYCCAQ